MDSLNSKYPSFSFQSDDSLNELERDSGISSASTSGASTP